MSILVYSVVSRGIGLEDATVDERHPVAVRRSARLNRSRNVLRRRRTGVVLVLSGLLIWLAASLGGALTNPTLGNSLAARFAEWTRGHGGASIVNWTENEWYSHHPPRVGGKPPKGSIRRPGGTPVAARTGPAHLAPAVSIMPFATPAIVGEGQ